MFKGYCFSKAIILHVVYFKLRFSLSYGGVEDLLTIRRVMVLASEGGRGWLYVLTSFIVFIFSSLFPY